MTVSVHESRDKDRVRGVDHLGLRWCLQIGRDPHDLFALNQNISLHKVAHLRIHRDDGSTLQQDVLTWTRILSPYTFQRSGILCVLRTLSEKWSDKESRACLEKAAPRDTFILRVHNQPPG